jgi:hypothetical protein
VKLKLTKCAPIPGLPAIGFFMPVQAGQPDAGNRAGLFRVRWLPASAPVAIEAQPADDGANNA